MKKQTLAVVLFTLAALTGIVVFQVHNITVYHDGRCAAQKWERHILWMDFSERDYDEFGIEERWQRAHTVPCKHIWVPGPLENDGSGYWPSLHLMVAQGRKLDVLIPALRRASSISLHAKDKLGRTIMHWAVIHPDSVTRHRLKEFLTERGLSLSDDDNDGLTPLDWESTYNHSIRADAH